MNIKKFKWVLPFSISLIIFQGYLLVFTIKFFEFNKYGIPYQYIRINYENLILPFMLIISLLGFFIAINYNNLTNSNSIDSRKRLKQHIIEFICGTFYFSGSFIIIGFINIHYFFILLIILILIYTIYKFTNINRYFLKPFKKNYFKYIITIIIILFAQFIIIATLSNINLEKNIQIIESSETLVLGIYDNSYIVTPYKIKNKEYIVNKNEFMLIDMNNYQIKTITAKIQINN